MTTKGRGQGREAASAGCGLTCSRTMSRGLGRLVCRFLRRCRGPLSVLPFRTSRCRPKPHFPASMSPTGRPRANPAWRRPWHWLARSTPPEPASHQGPGSAGSQRLPPHACWSFVGSRGGGLPCDWPLRWQAARLAGLNLPSVRRRRRELTRSSTRCVTSDSANCCKPARYAVARSGKPA